MKIRNVVASDVSEWARMRVNLWPGSLQEHTHDIERFFQGTSHDIVEAFVLERPSKMLGGMIELNIRNFAEGSTSPRVPYIEGWFIDEDLRGQGYGRRLLQQAESWAKEQGFHEIASDTELENERSIETHKALGFTEVYRLVCFRKPLS